MANRKDVLIPNIDVHLLRRQIREMYLLLNSKHITRIQAENLEGPLNLLETILDTAEGVGK